MVIKKEHKSTALILAAGFGSRIQDLSLDPKCLLPMKDQEKELSILQWHLEHLKNLKYIKDVILVVGYRKEMVEAATVALNKDHYFHFHFIDNDDFRNKGNTYSLYLGLLRAKELGHPVVVFDGDLVYEHHILKNFMDRPEENLILVGQGTLDDIECAKTLVDKKNRYVRKLVDKRAVTAEELAQYDFVGEAVGILKFSTQAQTELIKEMELFFEKEGRIGLNWEHLMNEYLPQHEVKSDQLQGGRWMEIDTSADYRQAQELFKDVSIL